MDALKNLPHRALGVVFLVLLLLGAWLTYAVFTKKFADYDELTLKTSKLGLQLPMRADVKVRGVIVGEVLDFHTSGDGAEVTLGIHEGHLESIPADVTGSILPKTLFGEKYVSLVPQGGTAESIEAGATIERTTVSTEVEQVLSDLHPLLETVRPADLNMTLNAMATALEGRGEMIGENVETLDAYLKRVNPQIPLLVEDLRLMTRVSDTYSDVMPEIAQILRDTVTTTGTLEDRDQQLRTLYTDVAAFSGTAEEFLDRNGDNLIRLGDLSAAQLRVLAKYAPQYPCLTAGIVKAGRMQAQVFRGFTLHIVLETLPNQPRGYTAADRPRVGETRGPDCLNLPNPPWSQQRPLTHQPNFDDGVDSPTGKGTSRAPLGWGYAGSTDERALLDQLLGQSLGVPADDVDDLGALLVGPMARGAEVSLR